MPSAITAASLAAEKAAQQARAKHGPRTPPVMGLYKCLRNCGNASFAAQVGQKVELPVEVARPLIEAGALRELTSAEFEADDGGVADGHFSESTDHPRR